MTKLEEVARAMRRRRIDLLGNTPADLVDDPSYLELALARAAVEALWEPGAWLIDLDPEESDRIWRKVIDAILNETPGEPK